MRQFEYAIKSNNVEDVRKSITELQHLFDIDYRHPVDPTFMNGVLLPDYFELMCIVASLDIKSERHIQIRRLLQAKNRLDTLSDKYNTIDRF